MTEKEFNIFLGKSKILWKKIEKFRRAYYERSNSHKAKSDILKWLTFAAGIITGVSSLKILFNEELRYLLTGSAGVITGSLSLLNQLFGWEKSSKENWDLHCVLGNLNDELYQFASDASISKITEDPSFYLQILSGKIEEATSCQINNVDRYDSVVEKLLQTHPINEIIFLENSDPHDNEENSMPDNAASISSKVITEVKKGE